MSAPGTAPSPPARVPQPWRAMLRRVAPDDDRASILQDLDEEYRQICALRGAAAARRWARSQVLRSLLPLLRRRAGGRRLPLEPRGSRTIALLHDLRYALRSLVASPAYGTVVVLVLSLGVGANTAIFSLVNPFLFRALPFADPHRLVHLFETDPRVGGMGWDMIRQSWPMVEALREQSESLEEVAAYYYASDNVSRAGAEPEQMTVGRVTVNLFAMLGAKPLHGRLFTPEEARSGDDGVVLVHESLWRSRFGADANVVGSTIRLDGREHVIVGVMRNEFNFPFGAVRMWRPLVTDVAGSDWDDRNFLTVGKLARGASIDVAAAEVQAIQRRLQGQAPAAFEGLDARVVPLKEALIFFYDQMQALMMLLLAAVALVLLIVCANLGNLALARASRRQREIAIRTAVGASRFRVLRQLLAESGFLSLLAAIIGVLLASAAIGAVASMIPGELWRAGDIEVDGAALGYTLAISLLAALAFGLLPARQLTRVDLTPALKEGGASTGAAGGRRLGKLLVASQVAVAATLCGSALMMMLAFRELRNVELGFDPHGVVSFDLTLPDDSYPGAEQVRVFWGRLTERVESLPGVESAAVIDLLPLNFAAGAFDYAIPGREPATDDERLQASAHRVSATYFDAMRIPVLRGRAFEPGDSGTSDPVVVVNRLLAERHWPGESPVGRTMLLRSGDREVEARVVGVAEPSMGGFVFNGFEEQVFRPMTQSPTRGGHLVVRAAGDPAALVSAVRGAITQLDTGLPVGGVRTMPSVLAESTAPLLVASQVLSSFGAFALLLAALGVYGVVAYAVARRTHEIGIRMALGAHPRAVLGLVLGSGAWLVLSGAVVGGLLTWLLGVALAAGGFGTPSLAIPLAVVALLALVAGVASWLPARRATRIDPAIALRAE